MARWARLALLASTLALLPCAACGSLDDTCVPAPPDEGARWHVESRPHWRAWGLAQKEYVSLALPEAGNATEDRTQPYPRFVLNVLATGSVLFKGWEWQLEAGVEEERRQVLATIRGKLALLLADPVVRAEDGSSLVPVLLHADRCASWRVIQDLLALLRLPDVHVRHLQIAVHKPCRTFAAERRGIDHRLDASMSESGPAPEDALEIRLAAVSTDAGAAVRLSAVDRAWTFGDREADFEDEVFLRRANAVWSEVEAALAARAQGAPSARIRLAPEDGGVPLAYVVTTLDLLLGLGIRDVTLPESGLRLELADPVAVPPAEFEDEPVLAPLTLAGGVLAVLLAFAITFLPWPRRRKGRKR